MTIIISSSQNVKQIAAAFALSTGSGLRRDKTASQVAHGVKSNEYRAMSNESIIMGYRLWVES